MINTIKKYFLRGICLSLLSGIFISCTDEENLSDLPDRNTLIEEGKYLTGSRVDGETESLFEKGTPYRLLIYSRPLGETGDESKPYLRANTVAWEAKVGTEYQHIELEDALELLGFHPIEGEKGEQQRSLSFYGFTYGKPEKFIDDSYISLKKDEAGNYYREESVNEKGVLPDLFRGELTDQNEQTVLLSSEIKFKHAFSQLVFDVLKQEKEWNIAIESVEVVGTYKQGQVDLFSGKITPLGGTCNRALLLGAESKEGTISVDTKSKRLGEMILFPTHNEYLSSGKDEKLGLQIEIVGDKDDVERFADGEVREVNGVYHGTIHVETIYSSTTSGDEVIPTLTPLYLKPNVSYTIRIVFMNEGVRIIAIVPQVYEWLIGEGTEEMPWQEQELGRTIVFDNIIWNDRNLGADGWDAKNDFENTIGYFYQANRNIPYWPFYKQEYDENNELPTPSEKRLVPLTAYKSTWSTAVYQPYPIVDAALIEKSKALGDTWYAQNNNIFYTIDEEVDNNKSYGYCVTNYSVNANYWKEDDYTTHPTPRGWAIPTFEQFQSIFPSTPFAGNLTFARKGDSSKPSDWSAHGDLPFSEEVEVLRVCVPFYKEEEGDGEHNCKDKSQCPYCKHWESIGDPGSYPKQGNTDKEYEVGPEKESNMDNEPDGDPTEGYCSVYIISREGEDKITLPDKMDKVAYVQREWGTIYGIKKVGTPEAYRIRWQVRSAWKENDGEFAPQLYVVVSRYTCGINDNLLRDNYKSYDWDNPVAETYFPIVGMVEGKKIIGFYNCGCEAIYATCSGTTDATKYTLRMKVTGNQKNNQYISIIKGDDTCPWCSNSLYTR